MKTICSALHIKEKTAMVGSGYSKFGFYWSLLRIGSVSFGLLNRFFHRIGYIKSIKNGTPMVAREHSILS